MNTKGSGRNITILRAYVTTLQLREGRTNKKGKICNCFQYCSLKNCQQRIFPESFKQLSYRDAI